MATRQGLERHIAGTPQAYVGALDLSGDVAAALSLTHVGWMDRTLGALTDAAPVWLGDPADRAAALLNAMAGAVDDLSGAMLDTERVQLALDELTVACQSALQDAMTGGGGG